MKELGPRERALVVATTDALMQHARREISRAPADLQMNILASLSLSFAASLGRATAAYDSDEPERLRGRLLRAFDDGQAGRSIPLPAEHQA